MTLIIAYVDKKKSYIASDTLGSNGYSSAIYKNKKIFRKGDMLVGGSGSYKQLQLMEKVFVLPPHPEELSSSEYMHLIFVESLITFLRDFNCLKESDGILTNPEGDFIFIYDSSIYYFQSDLCFMEPIINFETTGSGSTYAHAILSTLESQKKTMATIPRLKLAVDLTSEHIMSVGGEMDIISL